MKKLEEFSFKYSKDENLVIELRINESGPAISNDKSFYLLDGRLEPFEQIIAPFWILNLGC